MFRKIHSNLAEFAPANIFYKHGTFATLAKTKSCLHTILQNFRNVDTNDVNTTNIQGCSKKKLPLDEIRKNTL